MPESTDVRAKRLREMDEEDGNKDVKSGGGKGAKKDAAKGGKGKKAEVSDAGKDKKAHPVRNTFLFTSLFFLLLIGGVIAICRLGYVDGAGDYVYFLDPGGSIRGPIWLFLNPEEQPREVLYASEIDDLAEFDAELKVREEEVGAREAAVEERDSALDDREDVLSSREEVVNEWIEAITKNNAQGMAGSYDISIMVTTVAGMDPKKAAAMLSETDQEIVVKVLSSMKPAKASAIMNNLDKEYAAELMSLVFDSQDSSDFPDTLPGATDTTTTEGTVAEVS